MLSKEQLALELLKIQVQQGKVPLDAVVRLSPVLQQRVDTMMNKSSYTPDLEANSLALVEAFKIILSVVNSHCDSLGHFGS